MNSISYGAMIRRKSSKTPRSSDLSERLGSRLLERRSTGKFDENGADIVVTET